MTRTILESLSLDRPPDALSEPHKALWWLRKGGLRTGPEWERAHEICQAGEGRADFDHVHALAHLIEGDTANAGYWYRRAGQSGDQGRDLETEWARVAEAVHD